MTPEALGNTERSQCQDVERSRQSSEILCVSASHCHQVQLIQSKTFRRDGKITLNSTTFQSAQKIVALGGPLSECFPYAEIQYVTTLES